MKKYIFTLLLIASTFNVYSQLTESVNFGYAPIGRVSVKLSDDDKILFNLNYKASLQYEKRDLDVNMLYELTYASYSLLQGVKEKNELPDSFFEEGVTTYSAYAFFGNSLFNGKRFQIPTLVGLGIQYNKGEPFDTLGNSAVGIAGKIQPMFYISNKIAIYVEGNISWLFFSKEETDDFLQAFEYHLQSGIKINF